MNLHLNDFEKDEKKLSKEIVDEILTNNLASISNNKKNSVHFANLKFTHLNNDKKKIFTLNAIHESIKNALDEIKKYKKDEILIVCLKNKTNFFQSQIKKFGFNVLNHWVPGFLTNWEVVVQENIKRFYDLKKKSNLTKKEKHYLKKRSPMYDNVPVDIKVPKLIITSDINHHIIPIKEANIREIKVISIVDLHCSSLLTSHPVLGNSDSIQTVKYFFNKILQQIDKDFRLTDQQETYYE